MLRVIASAMVSPSARPRPSITAAMTPGRPYGSTAVRIISHRVAPRASAASSLAVGVCRNTSRESEVMIGSTMIASTREPSRIELPYGPSPPKIGIQPKYLFSQTDRSRDRPLRKSRPHRPNTTLGTAASRSIRKPSAVPSRRGA